VRQAEFELVAQQVDECCDVRLMADVCLKPALRGQAIERCRKADPGLLGQIRNVTRGCR
jgi:hypothetical protein